MRLISALFGLVLAGAVYAQEPAEQADGPCAAPEFQQFDFWVGEWTVTTPEGEHAGESSIVSVLGGCAVHESWASAAITGHSYSMYNAGLDEWRQFWVDSSGTSIVFVGGFEDGTMSLTAETPREDDTPLRHRLEWTPKDDGTVHQEWFVSEDAGETWNTVFHGIYTKFTE